MLGWAPRSVKTVLWDSGRSVGLLTLVKSAALGIKMIGWALGQFWVWFGPQDSSVGRLLACYVEKPRWLAMYGEMGDGSLG